MFISKLKIEAFYDSTIPYFAIIIEIVRMLGSRERADSGVARDDATGEPPLDLASPLVAQTSPPIKDAA